MNKEPLQDFIIVGGGFYGCCLGLFLRSVTNKVIIIEKEDNILSRGSKVNQARVHTGFHYPRSALTAVKSMILHKKFARDFSNAIKDDFKMLYAIANLNSKISSKRFFRMFNEMDAPIKKASSEDSSLFNKAYIDDVFECNETAFDYSILKDSLMNKLELYGVKILFNTEVEKFDNQRNPCVIIRGGRTLQAKYIFNVTYGNTNNLLNSSNLDKLDIKNELTEIAIISPPTELKNLGVTVMDGPFFSTMPFPSINKHSLTHVSYTPHKSWITKNHPSTPYFNITKNHHKSNYLFMIRDAAKYLPIIKNSTYEKSYYEIKSILLKSELNDSRPILFHSSKNSQKIFSIVGGKIDNIYDLFEIVKLKIPELKFANSSKLF